MAHVANPVSVRTMSLSLSTLMWGALLLAAVSIGSRIAAVLPPVVEDPPIEVITMALPPLVKSEPVIRPTPTDPDEAAAVTPVAPPVEVTARSEPSAFTGPAIEPAPAPIVTRPHWLRVPSGGDLAKFYPARAIERGKTGEVSLACLVRVDGTLACRVAGETPAGWGFGAAAMRISQRYQMEPATRDGAPVEARYTLRVPFELH